MNDIARMLIATGILLTLAGVVFFFITNTTGIPKLPGDIFIKRGNFTLYFPIVTSIIISIILTIIFNILFKKH